MRLDTHLHVLLKPFFSIPPTNIQHLMEQLNNIGLDGGWISPLDNMLISNLPEQQRVHDAMATMAGCYPGRLSCFCVVHPNSMEGAAEEIRRCVNELGYIGVKVHSWLQSFSLLQPGVDLIMQTAAELQAPVLFHDGTPPYATPGQVEYLAMRHPQTKIILGHAGLGDYWREAVDIAINNANIWLQPAAAPVAATRHSLRLAGADRMLFGSDGGFGSQAVMQFEMNKFRSVVSDEEFEQITVDNPKRLLGRR